MKQLITQTFIINDRYKLELVRNGNECAIELTDKSIDQTQIIEMEDKDMREFVKILSDSPYIFSSNNK